MSQKPPQSWLDNSQPPEPDDNTPVEGAPLPEANVGDTVRASWPFSLHDIRSNIAHCSNEGKEALIAAFLWCIDPRHPMHRAEFARRVGYSGNTIYQLYTGRYADPSGKQYDVPAELIKNIRDFLDLEKQRYVGETTFVMTPTAKRIWTACDLARESQTIVFLTGISHIGKTWGLESYASDHNHGKSIYVRMKAATGLGGMVRRIAERLGVSTNANTADLIDRIKRALTPNMILILDEVHLLMYTYRKESFFACLEVIREIHDEVECGMVLCATKLLLKHVTDAQHDELQQLLRRGVHKVPLPNMPTQGDLKAIFESVKLDFPAKEMKVKIEIKQGKPIDESPYALLRQIARRDGLKAITERLRYGRKLADKSGQRLTWRHVIEAHLIIEKQQQETPDWD